MDSPNFNQLVDNPTTAFDPVEAAQEGTERAAPDFVKPAAVVLEQGALHYDSAEDETWPSKKPERFMTWAWVLWAVPAVLVLAQFTGFALMFGAHWYYLGKMRRARTATLIWALTMAVFIVFSVFKTLELNFLAGLIGFVGLLPLIVIMLYRLIADVILLSKMASKQARRSAKRPSNRSRNSI
jgi:fatty acid desaturase